jgi:glucokinase
MLLVGDIGGTNARLALVTEDGSGKTIAEEVFESANYAALEELISDFLRRHDSSVDHAVFAVAGPVVGGVAELTNLGWRVDTQRLSKALGARSVRVVNDLQALAYGVPRLDAESLHTLQRGSPDSGGTIGVIAPGTGLGEAFATHDGKDYRAYASEGGHADFAPTGALQLELLRWMQERFDHVSYERVCSGRGIPNLFEFLEQRGELRAENRLNAQLAAAPNPTAVIVDAGLANRGRSRLSEATLDLFTLILGAETGNTALRFLTTGGMYLSGSLVQRLLPLIERPAFLHAFLRKGRLTDLLERVPLHVITHPNAALFGAIQFALADTRVIG